MAPVVVCINSANVSHTHLHCVSLFRKRERWRYRKKRMATCESYAYLHTSSFTHQHRKPVGAFRVRANAQHRRVRCGGNGRAPNEGHDRLIRTNRHTHMCGIICYVVVFAYIGGGRGAPVLSETDDLRLRTELSALVTLTFHIGLPFEPCL